MEKIEKKNQDINFSFKKLTNQLKKSLNIKDDCNENYEPLLLCVDLLNYSLSFMNFKNHWNIDYSTKKVSKFLRICKNSNVTPVIFIDGRTVTKEAIKKWRTRREKEIRKGERRIPQSTSILLGDLFKEQGVTVIYSFEADNDDTMASYAFYKKGAILSKDRDFLRYIDADYLIFTEFYYKNNKIYFNEQLNSYPKEGVKYRKILYPIPKTVSSFEDFMLVKHPEDSFFSYFRGSPTSLVYRFGNPHIAIQGLRQALYYHLNIKENVKELFPTWNFELEDVEWFESFVKPNNHFRNLLFNPNQAFKYFFSKIYKPKDITWNEWHNHVYSLHMIVYELCSVAMKIPLVQLLRESPYLYEMNQFKNK